MIPWDPLHESAKLDEIRIGGRAVRAGTSVRLRPKARADIFDMALDGKMATVEAIEQDFEGRIYLAVIVDDDPGKDFGAQRKPGHRFFYRTDEVELLNDGGKEP